MLDQVTQNKIDEKKQPELNEKIASLKHTCTKHGGSKFMVGICEACLAENGISKDTTIIDDDHLYMPKVITTLEGPTYICPSCKEPSILAFFNCCPNCRLPIKVKSPFATKYYEEKTKQIGSGKY